MSYEMTPIGDVEHEIWNSLCLEKMCLGKVSFLWSSYPSTSAYSPQNLLNFSPLGSISYGISPSSFSVEMGWAWGHLILKQESRIYQRSQTDDTQSSTMKSPVFEHIWWVEPELIRPLKPHVTFFRKIQGSCGIVSCLSRLQKEASPFLEHV